MLPEGLSSRPLYLEQKSESNKQKRRVPADIRKRVRHACLGCRSKKIRCRGTEPCHSCVALGIQCVYADAEKERSPSKQFVAELSKRQKCFEYLFEHICPSIPQCTKALVQLCNKLESHMKQGTPLASLVKPATIDESLCKFSLNSEEETSEKSMNQLKVKYPSDFRDPAQYPLNESSSILEPSAKTTDHTINFLPSERLSHDSLGPLFIGPTSSSILLDEVASSLNILGCSSPSFDRLSPSAQFSEASESSLPQLLQRGLVSSTQPSNLKSSKFSLQCLESLSLLACHMLPSLATARQLSEFFFVRFQCFLHLYPASLFYKRYQIFYNFPKLPNNLDISFLIVSMSIMALGQLSANEDGIHIEEPMEDITELFNLSEQLLFFLLPKYNVSTVQALAFVAFQCLLLDRIKEAFSYVGLAFHIARVIGLEVSDSTETLNDSVTSEINTRLLWSLRVLSSFLFLQKGITPIVTLFSEYDFCSPKLPKIMPELEIPLFPSTVSHFTSTIKLFSVAVPSLLSIYNLTGFCIDQKQDYAALLSKVKGASKKIEEWKTKLPFQLEIEKGKYDQSNPLFHGSIFLHLLYHHFSLLLFEPIFLYHLHLNSNSLSSQSLLFTESAPIVPESDSCIKSVQSILSLVSLLQENGQLENCFSLEYEILYTAASMCLLLSATKFTDDRHLSKCIRLLKSMGSVSINTHEKLRKLETIASRYQSEYTNAHQKASSVGNEPPPELPQVQEGYLAWKTWIQELSNDSDLPVGHSLNAKSNSNSFGMDSHSNYEKYQSSPEYTTTSYHPFLSWHEALLNMDIESNNLS
ncbi:DNA-binding transcription factor Thi5 [Schizosaccharomyces osmophilus]|uniref:DNA-binding transcription factor Thi5 n=1 Tax=Schizosaccharomyces osmophilus TaxID=2545709 RepID=A0AAE9W7J6_9SCHI|nr:DNA-binding transcription factor Thi5 [Schizosaccharomyces osmophilus]WBW71362.1 DNA-binding transcription factor Thi5 [Schizosaccharomyces osmophilus]